MNEELKLWISIATNAALAGFLFLWTMISWAYYIRYWRRIRLLSTFVGLLVTTIFVLRTFNVGGIGPSWSGDAILLLWLAVILLSLVYTVFYVFEEQLLVLPKRR